MGKYTEPAMFVNKQFEALNKGLTDMYSNIAKNADAIRKRELAKKQQSAKQIRDWVKVYEKGTQENYQGALDFTAGQPKDDNMKKFTNDLKSTYKQGYDNIARMVASGASEGEIASYVQDQINAANTFTEGIVAFDAYSTQYNAGVQKIGKEPGKYKGNQVGDVVVGSQYNNIFTSTGTKVGEKINIDKLKMSGNLSQGIQFYYDEDGDGNVDKGEVLDLNTMAKNYGGGKNPYFKEVEDFTEITKAYKAQIDNLEKAPSFVTETSVTDANGQTRKVQHVDRKKRQEFFMDPNTEGGKLIEEIIRSKDLTMLAQSVGGFDFAQKFDGDDPVMMEMLKIGLIEKLAPTLFPGSEKLGPSSLGSTTTSKQFEDRDPEIETITDFTTPIHKDVIDFAVDYDVNKLQGYKGRPYRQGSGDLDKGMIDSIVVPDPGKPNEIQVKYAVNGKLEVGTIIDMATDQGRALFEANIVNGNFPRAKRERIFGVGKAVVGGYEYDDSKTTTRITNRSGKPSMSIDDFNEQIQGTDEVIKFNDLYDSWESDWAGANPSTSASGSGVNVVSGTNTATGGGGNIVTLPGAGTAAGGGTSNATTTFQGLDVNNLNSYGPQATTSSQPNNASYVFDFHGLEVEPTKFKSGYPPLKMKQDGKDYIRQIGNFETYAGSETKGVGVEGYGFSGANAKLRNKFDNAPGKDLDEKFINTVDTYIIGGNTPGKDVYGNDLSNVKGKPDTSILTDLNMDRATFDALPDDVKKEIVDWKMNTGRSAADIVVIASGGDWDGDRGAASTLPSDAVGKIDYSKLTGDNLLKARQAMYKGTLDLIKKKHGVNSTKYKNAKKSYDNSQQYR